LVQQTETPGLVEGAALALAAADAPTSTMTTAAAPGGAVADPGYSVAVTAVAAAAG